MSITRQPRNEELIDLATQLGISTTGLTATQVATAVADRVGPAARPVHLPLVRRTADAVVNDLRAIPFEVSEPVLIDRVRGYVAVTQSATLLEIAVYNASMTKVVGTEAREIPAVGAFELALPRTTLAPGTHYLVLVTNATTAQFGVDTLATGFSGAAAASAPATLTSLSVATQMPALTLLGGTARATQGLFSYTDLGAIRVYGIDVSLSQPYGWNTATEKICKSQSSGGSFEDLMATPIGVGFTPVDMVIGGGKLYVLNQDLRLWQSSGLTAAATWTEITCPTTAGLRHAVAVGRPYGLAYFATGTGHVLVGEYTNNGAEVSPDGPRILRYDVGGATWHKSREFTGARHVHSLYVPGTVKMWASVGDAGYTGIGVYRLTPANIGVADGTNADTWTKWTSSTSPFTNHYPVDFMETAAVAASGVPEQLIMTSDRPGKHLLSSKVSGSPGSFNVNALLFQPTGGDSGETVRSLVLDANYNAYFWTAETTAQALWVSPPPYTQAVKLRDFGSTELFHARAVRSGGFLLMYTHRWAVEKFVGQA